MIGVQYFKKGKRAPYRTREFLRIDNTWIGEDDAVEEALVALDKIAAPGDRVIVSDGSVSYRFRVARVAGLTGVQRIY